jgi:hypothetical protein
MIRLAAMAISEGDAGRQPTALFPDGVEHPRFRGKKVGNGIHILCHKAMVDHLVESKGELRVGFAAMFSPVYLHRSSQKISQ